MPAYAVDVGPAVVRPTHHASLVAEDGTEIGLILCDASGNRLATSVARANLQTSPVKTTAGDSQYSDGELPFVVSAQSDYSGGIGQERFEDNRTKYHSGRRVQTVDGKLILGPREHFTDGYKDMVMHQPESVLGEVARLRWQDTDDPNAIAAKFTTVGAMTLPDLYLQGKAVGTQVGDSHSILFWIRNDDHAQDQPGTIFDNGDIEFGGGAGDATFADQHTIHWERMDAINSLAAATTYWLELQPDPDATATSYVELCVDFDMDSSFRDSSVSSDSGATWGAHPDESYALIFRIEEPDTFTDPGWYWWYRQQLYYLTRPNTGAPVLLMNGWRGVCDANGGNLLQLLDSTQTGWAGNTADNTIVWVFAGPGSDEEVPFRQVTASVSGVLTVTPAWETPHTTDTEYVVYNSNSWFPITHTIVNPPTGPPAIGVGGSPPDDEETIAYIPMGHVNSAIWMFRQVNLAGVFTTQDKSINDGTGGAGNFRALLMTSVQDDTLGPILVKHEDNRSSGSTGLVSEARTPGTWAAQAAWGGDEQLGDAEHSGMVNAIEYVNPGNDARNSWVLTRGELFARATGAIPALWAGILLPELEAFASERTGFALAVFNTSLYLSLAGGLLERLTGGNTLTDVGPTKGVGLPTNRRGEIQSLVSYPGQMFVAIAPTGSGGGFSTITRLTGLDSHDPIYEAPYNRSIGDMIAQRIPTNNTVFSRTNNKLWFREGESLMYVDLPSQGSNPLNDQNYQFAAEGYVSSSRIYANLDDRLKVFSGVKLVTDGVRYDGDDEPEFNTWVHSEYQVDDDEEDDVEVPSSWTDFPSDFILSPSEEVFLTNYTPEQIVPVRGRYIKLRHYLNSTEYDKTPIIRACLLESLIHQPAKYAFKMTVLFEDNQIDLLDQAYTDSRAWQQAGRLEEYAERLELFTLHAPSSTLDGAKVLISPAEVAPVGISDDTVTTNQGTSTERLIGTLSIIQVVLPDLGLVT